MPQIMLERLGSECTDLQGLRELTVNGLDAIAVLGHRAVGRVVWDLDWQRFDASGGRVRKMSVTDSLRTRPAEASNRSQSMSHTTRPPARSPSAAIPSSPLTVSSRRP